MPESELEREWRAEMMRRVTSIEAVMTALSSQIARFDHATVVEHERRLRSLELAWAKALGVLIAVQVGVAALWALLVWVTR